MTTIEEKRSGNFKKGITVKVKNNVCESTNSDYLTDAVEDMVAARVHVDYWWDETNAE